ncbi:MAG TPA: sodium:glutamate symporter [Acholeplasmataceae bacterium]|nr:sodium:glutamate symporter [Acholeplasmataceae bacterium]
MIQAAFNNSDYSNWRVIIMFFIVSLMLLIANMIRRRVKLFKKLLFPTAIIAGFIGLGVKYLLFGLDVTVGGEPILTNDFLNSITYHTIALGFIAMGLKTVKKDENQNIKGRPIKTGLLIVNTYLIQGIVGIVITIILGYAFTEVLPHVGLLLPMGYGQGPGQAGNIGGIFEQNGFSHGRSYGLAVATFGILWACVAGIFYINKRQKEGSLTKANEEAGKKVSNEEVETEGEIPVSEAIDKMSMQIILVIVVYGLSYLFMLGITKLIPVQAFTGLIWGFNFIFGMLFAMLVKIIHNKLLEKKIIRRKYTNEYMLDRITGVVFDFMIVASIMSIDIEIFTDTGLLVSLLVLTTVGGFLTYFYLKYTVPRLYPDYEREAYASLFGNLAGTASNGIALLREVDPNFDTPAADNLVTGSASAVMFGAPLLVITAIIYLPGWYYLWGSILVLIIFFVIFSYFMLKGTEKPVKNK